MCKWASKKLLCAFLGAAMSAAFTCARAADYPVKPITIVVPYNAGGAADTQARLIAEGMRQMWGQPVIVDNRPGASGTTGALIVSRSAPDGYMLVMGTSASHAVSVVSMPSLPYDPIKDFTPIALTTILPNVIFGAPSFKATGMKEVIEYERKNPGTPIATAGPGTAGQFTVELLNMRLGTQFRPVPYRASAPAMADILAGQVPLGILDISLPSTAAKEGRVRAYLVTSSRRVPVLPDVPTMEESVLRDQEMVAWTALWGPAGMPVDVVRKLNEAVRQILNRADVKARLEATGAIISDGPPEELTETMRKNIALFKEIAVKNKLKFD